MGSLPHSLAATLLALGLAVSLPARAQELEIAKGVRVARVGPYSSTAAAGLRPGDVLSFWFRPANPPGNPRSEGGWFRSPWDASVILSEQTQRGTVLLWGRRGFEDRIWTLPFGEDFWQPTVLLPNPGNRTPWCATATRCRHQAALAEAQGDPHLAAWFLLPLEEAGLRAAAMVLARQGEILLSGIPLRLLGQRLEHLGHLPQAASCYWEASEIVHAVRPGGLEEAQVLGNLASLVLEQGNLQAADKLGHQILAIRRGQAPQAVWFIAEALGFLAAVAARRGDLATTENRLVEARELLKSLGARSLADAKLLAHFGDFYVIRGDLASAASSYRGAFAIHERRRPVSHDGLLEALSRKLARVETARGNVQIAEQLLERSVPRALREERSFVSLPLSLQDLASVATSRTEPESLRHTGRILGGILSRDPAYTVLLSRDRSHMVLTFREPNQTFFFPRKSAEPLFFPAEPDLGLSKLPGFASPTATMNRETGDTWSVCLLREELPDYVWEPSSSPETTERASVQERIALLSGDLSAVQELLSSAELQALGQEASAAGWWGVSARGLCRAVDLLERQRSRIVVRIPEAHSLFEASTTAYHRACLEALLRLGRLDAAFHALESSRARSFLHILAGRDLTAEVPKPLDLDRALAALDPGTALLSYSVGKKTTFLFILKPEEGREFSVLTLPVGEKELREEVGAFGNLLRNGRSDVRALDAKARRLYGLLLRPVEKYLTGAERLLISPDGPLHTLPFAALRRKEQYLVEWKPIHSVISATVYAEITKARPPASDPGTLRLVAFGDPLYPAKRESLADPEVRDAARGHGFPPLLATRREVEGIASLFPQAEVFLGAEATEERAKQVAPEAQLLHFACHGFLNDRFPLNSGLALTLPAQPVESQDNGLLQAWEIFESIRLDADLVTLSACNTALGQEMGGEGLIGLTRAFQYAGARSVLASLWGVSDASTGELMKRFYTHLRAGMTKDEALRAAQSELIHKNGVLSHPYHWAAFQLFGDWK